MVRVRRVDGDRRVLLDARPRGHRLVGRHGERRLVDAQPLVGVVGRDVVRQRVRRVDQEADDRLRRRAEPGRRGRRQGHRHRAAGRGVRRQAAEMQGLEQGVGGRDVAVVREQDGDVEGRGVAVALVGQGVIDRDVLPPARRRGGQVERLGGQVGCRLDAEVDPAGGLPVGDRDRLLAARRGERLDVAGRGQRLDLVGARRRAR